MSKYFRYDHVEDFSEGLAVVTRKGKYGFIDTTGREVVPCKYDDAFDFQEGMAIVGMGEGLDCKYGYIDLSGNEIIPCIYEEAYDFNDGWAKVSRETDSSWKSFFIDKTGKEVLAAGKEWDGFYEGLARITRDDKTGFVDKVGNEVIPCKYDGASIFCEGMASVCESFPLPEEQITDDADDYGVDYYEKVGYIDATGREVVPCKYDSAEAFHEGLAVVELNRKKGFIDKTGKEVIPLQYDRACDFHDGLAQVTVDNNTFYIDKSGKEVLNLLEHGILAAWDFSEGLAFAICEEGGNWGYIDKTGKLVIPCKYFSAGSFHNGLARVTDGYGKIFFIDKTGNEKLGITINEDEGDTPEVAMPNNEEIPF